MHSSGLYGDWDRCCSNYVWPSQLPISIMSLRRNLLTFNGRPPYRASGPTMEHDVVGNLWGRLLQHAGDRQVLIQWFLDAGR